MAYSVGLARRMRSRPAVPPRRRGQRSPHWEGVQAIPELGTVLGIWAHPDDEAFLSGGLMTLARSNGQRVVCVTATRGEVGTDDPARWPPRRLGRLRERELAASLANLGVEEHHVLGYVDGTCDQVPPAEAVQQIAGLIDRIQPDTIVSFGSDGYTGHPDHMTVSRWAVAARALARPQARLLQPAATLQFARSFADLHQRFNMFAPGLPRTTTAKRLSLHLRLDDDVLDLKVAAMRAQASQVSRLYEPVGDRTFRRWWGEEAFVEARSEAPTCGWRRRNV